MKKLRYAAEAVILYLAFVLFRLMGMERASAFGGWAGRKIGPRLAASRKALKNLAHAFPEKSGAELDIILHDMWDNLGRVLAEYPHLVQINRERVTMIGKEHLEKLGLYERSILIGAHCGNWEIIPTYFNLQSGFPMVGIYREPNNPYVARILAKCRHKGDSGTYIAKSQSGTRAMLKTMIQGGRIGILIDQKYNQGIAARFFGRPAMTSSAFAQLSIKYAAPIFPVRLERTGGCNFRLTVYPPMEREAQSEAQLVDEAHRLLEEWISERPAQWLWLHRRWDSKVFSEYEKQPPL